MNWELILQVTVPTFLIMAFFWNKIDSKIEKEVGEVKSDIDEIKTDIRRVENSLNSIDRRLSHLEGRFEERGHWESRKTGTEQQK